jgi:hypothetical protein
MRNFRLHRRRAGWLAAPLLALLGAGPAAAVSVNPGFETGDTSGWTTSGAASAVDASFGITPTEGSFQGLVSTGSGAASAASFESTMGLTTGFLDGLLPFISPNTDGTVVTEASGIQQTFTAGAGDTLFFDFTFLTDESPPEKLSSDFLFYDLSGVGFDVLDSARRRNGFGASATPFANQKAAQTFEIVLPFTGTYTLTLGVADVQDSFRDTGAIFDGFRLQKAPEPDSFLLLGGGLLALAAHARRRRAG